MSCPIKTSLGGCLRASRSRWGQIREARHHGNRRVSPAGCRPRFCRLPQRSRLGERDPGLAAGRSIYVAWSSGRSYRLFGPVFLRGSSRGCTKAIDRIYLVDYRLWQPVFSSGSFSGCKSSFCLGSLISGSRGLGSQKTGYSAGYLPTWVRSWGGNK